jgi:hypothetical protein
MVDVRLEAGSAQNALKKALNTSSFPDDAVGIQVVDTVTRSNSRGAEYEDTTVYLIEFIRAN